MSDGSGTYTLLIEVAEPLTVDVGALGRRAFDAGWYAYTGSAFGPGGFARVDRHRATARGEQDTLHWHVDYLLARESVTIRDVATTPGDDRECAVARSLPGDRIDGFGASDCDCPAHLSGPVGRATLASAVAAAHDR